MARRGSAVAAVSPWFLALLFLVVLDGAATRSRFQRGIGPLENTHDMTRVMLGASAAASVVRALPYAIAIVALVLYTPTEEHVFLYQGF